MVHNHGTEEGKGLSCREHRLPDGRFVGECIVPIQPKFDKERPDQ